MENGTGVIDGVNPSRISGSQRSEFGPQGAFDQKTQNELDALERQINSASSQEPASPQATAQPEPLVVTTPAQTPDPQTQRPVGSQEAPQGLPIPQGIQVPDKFKTQDGRLDSEKLEKSLVNLEHYLNLERQMHQRSQPQQPWSQAPQWTPPQQAMPPAPQQWAPQWAPPQQPLEARVNEDIQRDPGTTVVNLMRAGVMQAEQSFAVQTQELRRRLELMEIAQRDPGVMTAQGANKLKQTLEENPWLWNSPTPWASAYRMSGPIAPIDSAPAAAPQRRSAPILPGGPAPAIPQGSSITSEADLRRHLSERYAKEPPGVREMKEAEFLEQVLMDLSKRR